MVGLSFVRFFVRFLVKLQGYIHITGEIIYFLVKTTDWSYGMYVPMVEEKDLNHDYTEKKSVAAKFWTILQPLQEQL